MSLPTVTIVGNLTADVELRYTSAGHAVTNFTVAASDRELDKTTNEWKDGATTFLRCTAWRALAEHIAGSARKGQRVLVTGKLKQHDFETKDGEKRSRLELEVDDLGVSVRFAAVAAVGAVSSSSTDNGWPVAEVPAPVPASSGWASTEETPW